MRVSLKGGCYVAGQGYEGYQGPLRMDQLAQVRDVCGERPRRRSELRSVPDILGITISGREDTKGMQVHMSRIPSTYLLPFVGSSRNGRAACLACTTDEHQDGCSPTNNSHSSSWACFYFCIQCHPLLRDQVHRQGTRSGFLLPEIETGLVGRKKQQAAISGLLAP